MKRYIFLLFLFLSVLFYLLALALPDWGRGSTEDGEYSMRAGLWSACATPPGQAENCIEITESFLSHCIKWSTDVDEKHQCQRIEATRAFLILAVLGTGGIFLILGALRLVTGHFNLITKKTSIVLMLTTVFGILAFSIGYDALVINGTPIKEYFQSSLVFGYSPASAIGCAVAGWIFNLITAAVGYKISQELTTEENEENAVLVES